MSAPFGMSSSALPVNQNATLDRCAQAIYAHDPDTILEETGCECCVHLHRALEWDELEESRREHFRGAARACLEATLPVSDGVANVAVDAVKTAVRQEYGVSLAVDAFDMRVGITAAIRAIVGGEG